VISLATDLHPEGGLPNLERKEEERDPDDGLEDGELHDKLLHPVFVHGLCHGHTNDERARECGPGEASDGPVNGGIAAAPGEQHPPGIDDGGDDDLEDDVGGDGAVVGMEGVDVDREPEHEEGYHEEGDEAVHGLGLL